MHLVIDLNNDLMSLGKYPTDAQAARVFLRQEKQLLEVSKCPDLVGNRGHYFGTDYIEPGETREQALSERGPGLNDSDKRALIEFLKTF